MPTPLSKAFGVVVASISKIFDKAKSGIIFMGGSFEPPTEDPFIVTTYATATSINLYYPVDLKITWGDGSSDTYNGTGLVAATHTYDGLDWRNLEIVGEASRLVFLSTGTIYGDILQTFGPVLGASITSFEDTFANAQVSAIYPDDLFINCVNVTSFKNTFKNTNSMYIPPCSPGGWFKHCPLVTTFEGCFSSIGSNGSLPQSLFSGCPSVTSFVDCFKNGNFYDTTSIDLWNDYPGATGTGCYTGGDPGFNDYYSIPAAWGGGGA